MLKFNVVKVAPHTFRCVLGEEYYFDFSITQFDLFGPSTFFDELKSCKRNTVYTLDGNTVIGDVASVRYMRQDGLVCILIRNGIRGEFYTKSIV